MSPMHPHLARTLTILDAILARATPEQLGRKPSAEKWSPSEVLEHLDKTYAGTANAFEKLLQSGEPRLRPLTWWQRGAQFVVITLAHMPGGRRAPEMTLPVGAPPQEVARS